MSNCLKCEASLTYVKIDGIKAHGKGGTKWNCVSYSCPSCGAIISVQMDPIAIKTDTVNEIRKR